MKKPAPSSPLGVTVRTPAYAALSREAVRRVEKHLRIPVRVIECTDARAFETKMRLDLLCPRVKVFAFDADWWPLRDMDFSGYTGAAVMGVHDAGVFHPAAFCKPDCETLSLQRELYLNTGALLFDNASAQHRAIFRTARSIEHAIYTGAHPPVFDFGEQSLLNAGIQRNQVPVNLLPFAYNCMLHFVRGGVHPSIPRIVHAVHAAGIPLKQKMRHLKAAALTLGYEPEPMQHEALLHHHALQHETR